MKLIAVRKILEMKARGEMGENILKVRDCVHGCIEKIKVWSGIVKVPVLMKLDSNVYRFQNTGRPYMVRTCLKCHRSTLILGVS